MTKPKHITKTRKAVSKILGFVVTLAVDVAIDAAIVESAK